MHFGLLLATFARQRSPRRRTAAAPAWIRQRPGPVVSPGEFLGEGMLQPRRPGRTESPRWLGWVWSGCPIVRMEARQAVVGASLESPEDLCIRSLNLSIAAGMCHGRKA